MEKVVQNSVLLFLVLQVIHNVNGDCLENLRVNEIINNGATNLTLGWDYSCGKCSQCNVGEVKKITFKIYWQHEEWIACDIKQNDPTKGIGRGHTAIERTLDVQNNFQIQVPHRLHPYSKYNLSVKAIPNYTTRKLIKPEEKIINFETKQGVPDVTPQRSKIQEGTTPETIRFYWTAPEQSKCKHFNGNLDGYAYELKGTSIWNKEYINHKTTESHTEFFPDLMPYSGYSLDVFAKNVLGEYNPELPLTLTSQTEPADKAGPPKNLKVVEINEGSQHQASWLPPFPPTGLVGSYSLEWKEAQSGEWVNSVRINKPFKECQIQDHYTINEYDKRLCFPIDVTDEISNYKNITYQIVAFNTGGSKPSDPSQAVFPLPEGTGEINTGFLILYIVVGVVMLILVILVILCIWNRRKYTKVPNYETTRPSIIIDHHRKPFNQPTNVNTMPHPNSPPALSRNSSTLSNRSGSGSYPKVEMQPRNVGNRPPSITLQPLPPIPPPEPLYEELQIIDKDKNNEDSHDSSKQKVSTTVLDEEGYLPPRSLKIGQNYDSDDNEEEYLKPTFGKFTRIDSRDLSPPHEQPPPIPIQSYVPVSSQENYSNHPGQDPKC